MVSNTRLPCKLSSDLLRCVLCLNDARAQRSPKTKDVSSKKKWERNTYVRILVRTLSLVTVSRGVPPF